MNTLRAERSPRSTVDVVVDDEGLSASVDVVVVCSSPDATVVLAVSPAPTSDAAHAEATIVKTKARTFSRFKKNHLLNLIIANRPVGRICSRTVPECRTSDGMVYRCAAVT